MDEPVCVRCYDDCYWLRDDFGDRYTPPSSECVKEYKAFEDLNIEPCYGERDETECPDCPFYLNYDRIVQMESEYHIGEPVTTNADDFRAMSDEELATRFAEQGFGICPPQDKSCLETPPGCYACWLDWLQSPADGGENDDA